MCIADLCTAEQGRTRGENRAGSYGKGELTYLAGAARTVEPWPVSPFSASLAALLMLTGNKALTHILTQRVFSSLIFKIAYFKGNLIQMFLVGFTLKLCKCCRIFPLTVVFFLQKYF